MEDFSPLIRDCKPGEVVNLPDGRKIIVGIDGEYDVVNSISDFELMHFCDDDGDGAVSFRDNTIRLTKGQAVKISFGKLDLDAWCVVRHRWPGGLSLVCPKLTSEQMLSKADHGRDCPLCGLLDISAAWFCPVVRHATRQRNGQWEVDPAHPNRILRLNERMCKQLLEALESGVNPDDVLFIAGRNRRRRRLRGRSALRRSRPGGLRIGAVWGGGAAGKKRVGPLE